MSRRDAISRCIFNECDLVRELAPYGFEAVTLTGMPFAIRSDFSAGLR